MNNVPAESQNKSAQLQEFTTRNAVRLLVLLPILFFASPWLIAQSDSELMAEGQAAMRNHDCKAARRAFEQVSPSRRDASWYDQVARTAECLNDLSAALDYYEQESKLVVGSERLTQKIGDLRYRLSKIQQQQAAFERENSLRQERAQERAAQSSAAEPTIRSLISLLNEGKVQTDKKGEMMAASWVTTREFNASTTGKCDLTVNAAYITTKGSSVWGPQPTTNITFGNELGVTTEERRTNYGEVKTYYMTIKLSGTGVDGARELRFLSPQQADQAVALLVQANSLCGGQTSK